MGGPLVGHDAERPPWPEIAAHSITRPRTSLHGGQRR